MHHDYRIKAIKHDCVARDLGIYLLGLCQLAKICMKASHLLMKDTQISDLLVKLLLKQKQLE